MTSVNTEGLDDYNPFTNNPRPSEPAIMKSENIERTEPYKVTERTSLTSANKDVPSYRESRKGTEKDSSEPNNWPMIPGFCPFKPCFYHDIDNDIPEPLKRLVQAGYYVWIGYSITMLLNMFGTLSYFLSTGSMEAGSTFGMSIIMLLILPVATFLGWYRPLYKAAKSDSSANYFVYFITSFTLLIITCIQCVGINWLGACGWLNSTIVVVIHKAAGTVMLSIAILFSILLASQIVLLLKVHQKYRNIDSPTDSSMANELKNSKSLREIASSSIKSGSNFGLEERKDTK